MAEECIHGMLLGSCATCAAKIAEQPRDLELGGWYKRQYVQKEMDVGGEPQIYLPSRDGVITSGWFVLKMNPDAPGEVLPERKGKIPDRARQLVGDGNWIPVFLKEQRDHDHYQYVGFYRGKELLEERDHPKEVAERQRRVKDRTIMGILRLERRAGDELSTKKLNLLAY